jgi:beta-glucosidase
VTVNVKNTGKYAGKETIQLYVAKPDSKVVRPEKELKAFKKVWMDKEQIGTVNITIPVTELAYYDVDKMKWVVESGEYKILAGASSKDIRRTVTINVK